MSYVLVATGLQREAKLIERPGVVAVACGGHGEVLEAALEARIAAARPGAVWSIGIAGALDPALRVGDIVYRSPSPSGEGAGGWGLPGRESAASRTDAPPPAPPLKGRGVVGVDVAATTVAAKAALRARTGADAVDMESHVAERVATRHGVPFGVLRIISDTAARDLPPAACVPLRTDGNVDLAAVLAALARRPGQLPDLLRLARDTNRALAVLLRRLDRLAADGLLGLDLGELGLDVL